MKGVYFSTHIVHSLRCGVRPPISNSGPGRTLHGPTDRFFRSAGERAWICEAISGRPLAFDPTHVVRLGFAVPVKNTVNEVDSPGSYRLHHVYAEAVWAFAFCPSFAFLDHPSSGSPGYQTGHPNRMILMGFCGADPAGPELCDRLCPSL